MDKVALYFGCRSLAGHHLHAPTGIVYPGRRPPHFPWTDQLMDTGLLLNRVIPDVPDGRVYWTCGGDPFWLAFFWWDRSGDSRPNSNSGFYVRGFDVNPIQAVAAQAFDYACERWPDVVERQQFALVLQP